MVAQVIRATLAAMSMMCGAALADNPGPRHAIAMIGEPALPAGFDHLPYADPAAAQGGRLTLGVLGAFDSLNPFNVTSGSTAQGLSGHVFQTLMARNWDEPFTLYALVAQDIEMDAERAHVTIHLDPRTRFSDGSQITSADVRFTFELLREKGRPQFRIAYSLVRSLQTPDARTVTYDLTGAGDRELPLILMLMPVFSRDHTEVAQFTDASYTIPLGSGPYVVSAVEPGRAVTFKRSPAWWANDLPITRGLYNFDEIRVEYYRDPTALFEAFKAGLVDYREETNPGRWLKGYDFPAIRDGRMKKAALPLGAPKGMAGYAFNTRRAVFAYARVREALATMFDFEWINANLFGGLYRRTKSFFDESELASTGRSASERERRLLSPFPDAVRADILAGQWRPPVSDGSGRDRVIARSVIASLAAAGYDLRAGKMLSRTTGEPLSFEIMVGDRAQQRLAEIYAKSLARIGVEARVRLVDDVQYQRRRQTFDFDMAPGLWQASASPGNEQKTRWGSQAASREASFNLAGAQSPAIDAMIDALLAARDRDEFIDAARALDRTLLSGFYVVPFFHAPDQWFAWSAKLAFPEHAPRYATPLFGTGLDMWWRKSP